MLFSVAGFCDLSCDQAFYVRCTVQIQTTPASDCTTCVIHDVMYGDYFPSPLLQHQ